jgi:phosphatidylglycerophosphate synthase
MTQPSTPQRSNEGFLQPVERPALRWLAERMPAWVSPDILTGIGFFGACVAAGSYILAGWHPGFLWLATLGLIVNWFGDSLDGNLARYRKIERPRYGFFLDQNIDAFAQLMFATAFGLSGYIRFDVAIFTLATYFLMTIFSLVRSIAANIFAITTAGIGLTEIRLGFAALNVMLYFYPPVPFVVAGFSFSYPDAIAVLWVGSMLITFAIVTRSQLRRLAAEERPVTDVGLKVRS